MLGSGSVDSECHYELATRFLDELRTRTSLTDVCGCGGALSSLYLARLPLGAPHHDLSRPEGAGKYDPGVGGQLVYARRRLDVPYGRRVVPDAVNNAEFLHQIYTTADAAYGERL